MASGEVNNIKRKKSVFYDNDRNHDDRDVEYEEEDYITYCMGSFGLYQAVVCTIASLSRFLSIWNTVSGIFLTTSTDFICKEFKGSVPSGGAFNTTCYLDCAKYEYYTDLFASTLISSYDLVCERAWLIDFSHTVMMLGILAGSWYFGWVSDRFGRSTALKIAVTVNAIFTIASAYAPNVSTFIAFRTIIGVTSGGIFVASAVYILEVFGTNYRAVAGCWVILPDGIAQALLSLFAYYSSTWSIFVLEYGIVSVIIALLVLKLPKTPKWLVANGKIEKAVDVLASGSKINRRNIPEIERKLKLYMLKLKLNAKKRNTHHFDLIKTKELTVKTLCIFIMCTEVGIGFVGINQYVTIVESNIYITIVFLGLIQIPMSLLSIILNQFFGRRILIGAVFLITAISTIILSWMPKGHWLGILAGAIGMSAIIISFIVISIYIAELFPTPLRSMAFGVGVSGSYLGNILTPFIMALTPGWVPSFILAVLPCIAAGVSFFLTETKGLHLTDKYRYSTKN